MGEFFMIMSSFVAFTMFEPYYMVCIFLLYDFVISY